MRHQRHDEHFRSALEAAPTPMMMVNKEGRIVFVNGAAEKLFGYNPAELLGQEIEILVPDASRGIHVDLRRNYFGSPIQGVMSGSREICAQAKNGALLQVEIRLTPIETPQGTLVLTTIFDIREHKRATQRFRLAVEASPVAMILLNRERAIVFLNSQAERLFGYRSDELTGRSIDILVPEPARKSGCDRASAPVTGRQMGLSRDVHARRSDGSWFAAEISLNPIETSEGVCILASVVDISFHRHKLESVGMLAGGIAHDFNNLLGSILADTELALSELAYGSSAVEEIQNIRTVAIRASEIVRELMIFAGQEKPHRELIDLSGLVQEMLELLKVSISRHAQLKTNLGPNLPPLMGNSAQIRQVAMNLIINASDAIGGNGLITVTTSCVKGGAELAPDWDGQLPDQEYLRLDVSDNGRGITQTEKAKVFDPFFTTKSAGQGIGLAVVQEIVRAHGGAIDFQSAVSKGTTFHVFFPCATERATQEQVADSPLPNVAAADPARTLLLVEDEDALRLPVGKILRKNGYITIEAADGDTAVEVFRSQSETIDVILLDMTIPGLSGLEVLREVRRIRPNIDVILTSAYSLDMLRLPPDAPAISGFIRKPFQLSELLRFLQNALRKETITRAAG